MKTVPGIFLLFSITPLLGACGGGGGTPVQAQNPPPAATPTILSGVCANGASLGATAQAATPFFLFGLGRITDGVCGVNSTSINFGLPMPSGGVLTNLRVDTFSKGTSATNGTFTVYVNNSSTAITCAVGTGSTCADIQHEVSVGAGDVVGVALVLQPGESFSGQIRAALEKH